MVKERTRDDLIDSIIHTRTKEHRVMPGFLTASRSDIQGTSRCSVGSVDMKTKVAFQYKLLILKHNF